jgi:hypothetical protein
MIVGFLAVLEVTGDGIADKPNPSDRTETETKKAAEYSAARRHS